MIRSVGSERISSSRRAAGVHRDFASAINGYAKAPPAKVIPVLF